MFPWLPYALIAYLVMLLGGLVMSFVTRSGPRRRNIRIGTAVFSIPLWLMIGGCVWLWYNFFREPPTLAELGRNYPAKRADLEMILRMSDEDSDYSRIAPDFLDRTTRENQKELGLYTKDDVRVKLPKARWDAYRKIYNRNGIELGIQRNSSHDAFIMVHSIGFLDHGHVSGYLYCAPDGLPDAYRFEPCSLNLDKGERKFDGGQEGYSFQRLSNRWFAFDQGPM